jgi:purine-nucleoside/S-methyl-5'-thioadenosine phosphorylase / adenosine deaminase
MSLVWLAPDWPVPGGVRALSTWRSGGVSSGVYASLNLGSRVGDEAAAVAENRRRLALAAGLPAEPCWLPQVHGTEVADLDAPPAAAPPAPQPGQDAAVTRQRGRVCAILSADCVPVLFAALDGGLIGAAHAGWRGLAAGVLAATVAALKGSPERLMAWIGPCIGPDAYEVGSDVRDAVLAAMPGAAGAFRAGARSRFMADLPMISRLQLQALGLTRIYGGTECTYRDPIRYFSYRRDGQTGRQATLIWLE